MGFVPFAMERWQSLHEHDVDLNLSDSGVHPLSLREFLTEEEFEAVLDLRLIYTQSNGTPELCEQIATLYDGASGAQVQVTNGGAEANLVSLWALLEPGDEVVLQIPNYMQPWGIVRSLGYETRDWEMVPDFEAATWRFDLDDLARQVNEKTKLICICNPNNPTGACLGADVLDAIAEIARGSGAWVLSDESYRDSEHSGVRTATMWGRGEKVLVTNGLSKTFGLPGLRLGWILAPTDLLEETWARHDYTTISPGAISDFAASIALRPDRRKALLARTRQLLARNYASVTTWLEQNGGVFRFIPPQAGAMLYLRYDLDVPSLELAERLRTEQSVLVVPGAHFGMENWLRIGFGSETRTVEEGLSRIQTLVKSYPR